MAAGWKKFLLEGDAAAPSDAEPEDVGTVAAAGVAADCSRSDHVHRIDDGAIDASSLFAAGVVDNAALAEDAVEADNLLETDTYTMAKLILSGADPGSELVLTPKSASASVVVGTIYFDTEDDRPKVYVAAV